MKSAIASLCLSASLLTQTQSVHAEDFVPDGINVSYGHYLDLVSGRSADYTNLRLGITWDWKKDFYQSDSIVLSSYFELAASSWKSHLSASDNPSPDGKDKVTTISFSPVLRMGFLPNASVRPFIDLGVGAAYLSEQDLEKEKRSPINMGGHSQFEIRLMAGVEFGAHQQFELSYGWFHYSNAGLHSMNESIDFHSVTFGYNW
ncbi:acyloxyacyl hydrolase [Endozoicomonas sp. 8E]|uniref:acyloxyacyl hydrolase n=1 Tax=Endozoicomonas sp. 8E TaxID=3035692 RepID=UPI00293945C6|nr:acyloxyacyl hydrolase [Endozoicomonas sp. 8E]WOG29963.1 acyloxyacyl hydrolase [Endozoicomonas sp. 8E]